MTTSRRRTEGITDRRSHNEYDSPAREIEREGNFTDL
jgi:hypothetical protein